MTDQELKLVLFALTLVSLAYALGIITGYVLFKILSERRGNLLAEWLHVVRWQRDQALKQLSRRAS